MIKNRTIITNVLPQIHKELAIMAAELGIPRIELYRVILEYTILYSKIPVADMLVKLIDDRLTKRYLGK